jgi:hypothetical protein
MTAETTVSILKRLFLNFFERMDPAYYSNIARTRGKFSSYDPKFERFRYASRSKSIVIGFSATINFLANVIGQAGVDAFNSWLGTYAGGTGALTSEALRALRAWYDTYLKPLS